MSNSLVVPLVLWGPRPPTHRICSVLVLNKLKTIVTGCRDGQLICWHYDGAQIMPSYMLFGHTSAVISIAIAQNSNKKQHIISASDNGELCLWDLTDGRCLEQARVNGSPSHIVGFSCNLGNSLQHCIMCYGQMPDIIIFSASSLAIVLTLSSRILPEWIACATVCVGLSSAESCNIIGLTVSGLLKVWRIHHYFTQLVLYEEESKHVGCTTAVGLQLSKINPRLLLIVCPTVWMVCDSSDYSVLCSESTEPNHQWIGGDFLSSDTILMWSRQGTILIYRLPFSGSNQESFRSSLQNHPKFKAQLLNEYLIMEAQQFLLPPVITLYDNLDSTVALVMGTCSGTVSVAKIHNIEVELIANTSLELLWNSLERKPVGIVDKLQDSPGSNASVTASLFVTQYCYLCCGLEDGRIVVVSAAKTCKFHLLDEKVKSKRGRPHYKVLQGHRDSITCLLYPHQEAPERYSSQVLVSGSADFSVATWDMIAGTLLHTFHIHGGEVTQLIIPPDGCSHRVSYSICSIAHDYSVALLSLRDRKCILLASRHPSPITGIRWRPDHDFLIISCSDGRVYIWQMETGHLDRYEQGTVAAGIIAACDESDKTKSNVVAQNSINFSQALKTRSLSAFKAVAQQGLKSLIEGIENEKHKIDTQEQNALQPYNAMIVSPLRASPVHDPDSHVVFINTESLVARLLMEHSTQRKQRAVAKTAASVKSGLSSGLTKHTHSQYMDDESDPSSPEAALANSNHSKKKLSVLEVDSSIDIAQLVISCIHAWGLDSSIDKLCWERLGLLAPCEPISFGLLSQHGHMALLLPRQIQKDEHLCINPGHWQTSSALTTQHLVSLISIANTMMELPHTFKTQDVRRSGRPSKLSQDSLNTVDQSQVKQGWSLLATLHCVLLRERLEPCFYKPPKLEMLARRWQDRCLEIREAAQALLLAELRQMGCDGRRMVVDIWSHHVPDYIYQHTTEMDQLDSPSSYMVADHVGDRSSITSNELITSYTTTSPSRPSYEVRRRHATAIVILGVIGAEFGQELDPRRVQRSDVPEGFGLSDYSLARHTCKALVYLLLQPPCPRLPAHIPIRRAAIDLIGRGFAVWEPYMEVSAVLLALLELCETYSKHIASIQSGLPLSPEADSCRSAHHSLSLIATARPLTFVTTIAREVARYNAASANPQHQALLASSVLVRAKPEILRMIELLADKMMSDMNKVLVEVVDIVLFCIDVSLLRASYGLLETVPALAKFHTISYDSRSRRAAVASGSGSIVLYDVRSCKHQVVPRGKGRITALSFSPDGRFLAVYCASENQLSFWATATSLFGMLQPQVKCVKMVSPLKNPPSTDTSMFFKANLTKLVWVNNRSVVLLTPDGAEHRFHV